MAHILIAEENQATANYLYKVLKHSGNTAVIASRSLEAWRKASSENFDVLVVNIALPGMDGLVLAQRALNENSEPQVIFVSGFAAASLDNYTHDGTMLPLTSRPFHLSEIAARVRYLQGDGALKLKISNAEEKIENNVIYADFSRVRAQQGASL